MKNLKSLLPCVLLVAAPWTKAHAADGNRQHGLQVFQAKCSACHSAEKGDGHIFGPNLSGVVGRPAGKLAGFEFSNALSAASTKWDQQSLDVFLKNPTATYPGTAMTFSGIENAEDRSAVISYLKSKK